MFETGTFHSESGSSLKQVSSFCNQSPSLFFISSSQRASQRQQEEPRCGARRSSWGIYDVKSGVWYENGGADINIIRLGRAQWVTPNTKKILQRGWNSHSLQVFFFYLGFTLNSFWWINVITECFNSVNFMWPRSFTLQHISSSAFPVLTSCYIIHIYVFVFLWKRLNHRYRQSCNADILINHVFVVWLTTMNNIYNE